MNKCIDCNKEISKRATRCHSCVNKITKTKNGLPKCKFCGKQLVNYGKERCQSCAAKERYKDVTNNPNYKDGRSLKDNFCIDCNKKIDWKANYCKKCMQKKDRNHQYIDGRSYIDYPESWNNELKTKIMKRDNYTCQNCGKYPAKICVHHKDKNKKNCQDDNLITLCRKCHGQIHHKKVV